MDKAIFLAMSGAKQDMQGMQTRANNLANISTTGFRADLEQARSMQAYGEGLPTRVFTMAERPGYRFNQGPMISTGRDLDVAIQGEGWLSIIDENGEQGYTRAGNLRLDNAGMLKNARGQLVLGENDAEIFVPLPISKIEIAADGTVSVLPQGAPPDAMEVVDRIKLVNPDNKLLFKDNNGVFKAIDPNAQFVADANVTLQTGTLEGSNVNAIGEMTHLIDLQRQFEMQVKMMKTAEELDSASTSLLRTS